MALSSYIVITHFIKTAYKEALSNEPYFLSVSALKMHLTHVLMTTFCWKQSWFFEVCVSICYGILFLVGCHLLLEPIFPCPPFLRLQSHMFSKHLLSKIFLTITSVILSRLLHDLEVGFNSFSSYLAPHIFNALYWDFDPTWRNRT